MFIFFLISLLLLILEIYFFYVLLFKITLQNIVLDNFLYVKWHLELLNLFIWQVINFLIQIVIILINMILILNSLCIANIFRTLILLILPFILLVSQLILIKIFFNVFRRNKSKNIFIENSSPAIVRHGILRWSISKIILILMNKIGRSYHVFNKTIFFSWWGASPYWTLYSI